MAVAIDLERPFGRRNADLEPQIPLGLLPGLQEHGAAVLLDPGRVRIAAHCNESFAGCHVLVVELADVLVLELHTVFESDGLRVECLDVGVVSGCIGERDLCRFQRGKFQPLYQLLLAGRDLLDERALRLRLFELVKEIGKGINCESSTHLRYASVDLGYRLLCLARL